MAEKGGRLTNSLRGFLEPTEDNLAPSSPGASGGTQNAKAGFWARRSPLLKWAFGFAVFGSVAALFGTLVMRWAVGYPVEGLPNPVSRSDLTLVLTHLAGAGIAIVATVAMLLWRVIAIVALLGVLVLGLAGARGWGGLSTDGSVWWWCALPLGVACLLLIADVVSGRPAKSQGGHGA